MKYLPLIFFVIILVFPADVFADQFITIVNPIRISVYSSNPRDSLLLQYSQVKKRKLPATWLLTYDVISDIGIVDAAKTMDKSQELGIFLEVTPKFASESGITYNKTDSWHRANSVFLSGYTQKDRLHLIDSAFAKFKQVFNSYPSSVGAWWIDSYSLQYMKDKYGITANLTVADQFSTDGYQIWGQYWSTPFYPSKFHAGMPARSKENKLDIVTIQWAPRDPLNGYGRAGASLFSTQDRFEVEYSQKLLELYAKSGPNKFGQIVLGLEGDFPPSSYSQGTFFTNWLDIVKAEKQNGVLEVVTMRDFSNWYKTQFPDLSPVQIIQSDDLLGKKIKTFWYNSVNYRVNIVYNSDTKQTVIKDFRSYHDNFEEPYYISPNRDLNLTINLPSQIDSAGDPNEEWKIFDEELVKITSDNEELVLSYKNNNQIKLTKLEMMISGNVKDLPKAISESPQLDVKNAANIINVQPKRIWSYPKEGLIFRNLNSAATNFLKQKKVIAAIIFFVLLLVVLVFWIRKKKFPLNSKIAIISILILLSGALTYKWYLSNSRLYFISQSELDALTRLRLMSGKRIVIFDKVCLQCSWHTNNIPAVFANKRDYVKKVTGKEIIYNSSIFNAKTRPEAKKELDKLSADYIYLVKFEDYKEIAPFSPGDLNIEEIYSNANAQVWKVRKN